jgi:hypothetical protein
MDTIVRAACPKCRTVLRIPVQWVGQTVKCKKCGALVRSKPKNNVETLSSANGTAESAPLDQTIPNPDSFDFSQPAPANGDDPFPIPEPLIPPAPEAHPLGGFDAGPQPQPAPVYPYPVPPGYPYAPPPGYPYPVSPAYGPPGAYAPPPGYPYPLPPGYAPPAGYPYPAPPAAAAIPHAVPPGAVHAPQLPRPIEPPPAAPRPEPVAAAPEFESATSAAPPPVGRRYRRGNGKGKLIGVAVCLLLTGGLIAGGVFAMKHLADKNAQHDPGSGDGKNDGKNDGKADGKNEGTGGPIAQKAGPYPRRLLFISISKYMYLNPLTATKDGAEQIKGVDQSRPAAQRIAFDWRIPSDKDNNQVFILSDTGANAAIPVKNVLAGAYERFFETSREQDRIVLYFGGHAIEKDGKAYLAPVEGEMEGDGWQQSLIPLGEFYAKLQACKAQQKVVIWDVCRFNPQRGKQRPGSDPMTPALHKALTSPPAGVEVVVSCSPGENALEFYNLQPDLANRSARYGGSLFLESVRYVGEKSKSAKTTTPVDPLPIGEWAQAVSKRAAEMAAFTPDRQKQTVRLEGKPRADSVAYKPDEPVAKRFDLPVPPKGVPSTEIKSIEREFFLPPIRSELTDTDLADLPYLESVMKDYKEDVPEAEIRKDREKYKLRAVTLDAFDAIREVWGASPEAGGLGNLAETVEAPITETIKKTINKGLEAYAIGIAKLELINIELDNVATLKASETKRWQAHYEYARAVVKSRLAYLNEYNKLMGNVRTETLPSLDAKLGQNSYKLASSEKMKSNKDIQKLAEEAQEAYGKLIAEHRGTPWAIQAKRDRSFSLGLVWLPFVSKGESVQ